MTLEKGRKNLIKGMKNGSQDFIGRREFPVKTNPPLPLKLSSPRFPLKSSIALWQQNF
jgi:hypothetical protein